MIKAIFLVAFTFFAATIHSEESLKLGAVLEPPGLDPTRGAAAAVDEVVYANVFEGLTRLNRNGEVAPALAKEWTASRDAKTFSFELREGVKFHDGSAFTSSDVKFSFLRAASKESENVQKASFANIQAVETPSALEVVIRLKEPRGDFPYFLSFGDAAIVSPKTAEGNASNPVGTGPYRFDKWDRGNYVRLKKFKGYWGKPVRLDRAEFRFISDPNAAQNALLAGDVDGFPNFPAPELMSVFEADPRFNVEIGSTEGETILAMNNGRKPFSDPRVRKAIAHAVNKKQVIEGAVHGYGQPIGSHFPPARPAYADLNGKYPFNPAKARKLLKEAGLEKGFAAEIKLPPPSYARRSGLIIASQLREVGVEVRIMNVEWAQWLEQVFRSKNYDLTIVSHTEPADLDIYARENYYFNYSSRAYREIIAKLGVTSEESARRNLMRQAQELLAEDSVNVFLFMLPKTGVWKKNLHGLWKNSPIQANDLTEVYWRKP